MHGWQFSVVLYTHTHNKCIDRHTTSSDMRAICIYFHLWLQTEWERGGGRVWWGRCRCKKDKVEMVLCLTFITIIYNVHTFRFLYKSQQSMRNSTFHIHILHIEDGVDGEDENVMHHIHSMMLFHLLYSCVPPYTKGKWSEKQFPKPRIHIYLIEKRSSFGCSLRDGDEYFGTHHNFTKINRFWVSSALSEVNNLSGIGERCLVEHLSRR